MLRRLFAYFVFNFKRGGFSTDLQHNLLELILFECQFWSSSSSTVRSNRRALPASSLLWNCMRIAFFLLLRNGMIKGHDGEKRSNRMEYDRPKRRSARAHFSFFFNGITFYYLIYACVSFGICKPNEIYPHTCDSTFSALVRSFACSGWYRKRERERERPFEHGMV